MSFRDSFGDDPTLDDNAASEFDFDPAKARQTPRDYQRHLIDALSARAASVAPGTRLLVHLATGGGKTRVCNDWLWNHALPRGARVLWVTKDWELLGQAAADLCQRYQHARPRLGYVGDNGSAWLPALAQTADAPVVYTTIQTWDRNGAAEIPRSRITHVVIDEVHWGAGAPSYGRLYRAYRDRAIFVGLTATPRGWMEEEHETVGRSYTFMDLVERGALARPLIEAPVHTGIRWRPERSGTYGDFTQHSLEELARSRKRNALIVRQYCEQRDTYGKTLVFACNVAHAARLARMFQDEGIAAEAVHSDMTRDERKEAIRRFRASQTEVLVNVAMLTHGVDIPDIRTVFFARPTASPILASQMRGRGSRLAEGKTEFHLVNFDDILEAHTGDLIDPTEEARPAQPEVSRASRVTPVAAASLHSERPRRHSYEPSPVLRFPAVPLYETLQGLEYQPDQTFGIEFEFTHPDFEVGERPRGWETKARALLAALREAGVPTAGEPVREKGGEKDNSVWNVEWDASCGWEVTTRVLRGVDGFCEVKRACQKFDGALRRTGLTVDTSTGTHVHLGWRADARKLGRLMALVAAFEPALLSLVPPSRAGNAYCAPVRGVARLFRQFETLDDWRRHFSDPDARYLAVNPSNLFGEYRTLEVRLHSGTWEAEKILAWTSLWMRLLEAVDRGVEVTAPSVTMAELPLCSGPAGDLTRLCGLLGAGPELVKRLLARRQQVVEGSWLKSQTHGQRAREAMQAWAG